MYMNHNKSIELQEAVTKYIEWKATYMVTAKTSYRNILRKFQKCLGDTYQIQYINNDDIIVFHKYLVDLGFSDRTIFQSFVILKVFLHFWNGRGLLNLNPKEIRLPRYVKKMRPVVEEEEFKKMISVLDHSNMLDLQKSLVIRLLWDTGMRRGELMDMKVSNLSVDPSTGIGMYITETEKLHQDDYVTWSPETNEILQRYLQIRNNLGEKSDYLIVSLCQYNKSATGMIAEATINNWVRRVRDKAGIENKITAHSFRHGKAHFILDNNGTIFDVQKILRHSNLNSSIEYTRMNRSRVLNRAQKFFSQDEHVNTLVQDSRVSNIAPANTFVYNRH